jgi:hypothetical protein
LALRTFLTSLAVFALSAICLFVTGSLLPNFGDEHPGVSAILLVSASFGLLGSAVGFLASVFLALVPRVATSTAMTRSRSIPVSALATMAALALLSNLYLVYARVAPHASPLAVAGQTIGLAVIFPALVGAAPLIFRRTRNARSITVALLFASFTVLIIELART